jgi:Chlorophyll A-B binding protein
VVGCDLKGDPRLHHVAQQKITTTCPHNFSSNIMKLILASLLASAAAFAPVSQKAASTTSLRSFADELGAQAPLGFFDPLGMVADGDQAKFDRLRYVEIKHGRICQLGVVGYLTNAAGIYLPGDISYDGTKFSDLGYGWDASFAVPVAGALQVLAFVGFLELFVMKDIEGTGNEHVGDFRNGAIDFGWDSFDDATKLQKRAIELNQGRAAQMGLLGLMVHDKLGNVEDFFPN